MCLALDIGLQCGPDGATERFDFYDTYALPCPDTEKMSVASFWWLEFIITIFFGLDFFLRLFAAPVRILSIDWNKLHETVGLL